MVYSLQNDPKNVNNQPPTTPERTSTSTRTATPIPINFHIEINTAFSASLSQDKSQPLRAHMTTQKIF